MPSFRWEVLGVRVWEAWRAVFGGGRVVVGSSRMEGIFSSFFSFFWDWGLEIGNANGIYWV